MRERRLPISLEGLWNNPNEIFTVRYKDINTKYQAILAKRIKETAKQTSLRKENGPTIEAIQEALDEINPVIFSEMQRRADWYRGHQLFGMSPATYIAGYRYEMLCRAVYLLTCRKKALNQAQIVNIARLTFNDWEIVEQYVNERLGLRENEEEQIEPIENLGIEDIRRAREHAEANQRNSGDIPTLDENYDTPREESQDITLNRVADSLGELALRTIAQRQRPDRPVGYYYDAARQTPPLREWQQRYMPGPIDPAIAERNNPGHSFQSFQDEFEEIDNDEDDDEEDDIIERLSETETHEEIIDPWELPSFNPPLQRPAGRRIQNPSATRIGLDTGI